MTVVIVDSGSANLRSIYKAAETAGLKAKVTDRPKEIAAARAVIFPGVGSFNHAASAIKEKNLGESLHHVINEKKPFLGICLGMQLLFSESEEAILVKNPVQGLDVVGGKVKRLPGPLPVPHVGWNTVKPVAENPLFGGLSDGAYFYFTHSYYVQPADKVHTLALTNYGFSFTSAIAENSLYGVQFHPEKSGPSGLRLLANFGKIIADQC